MKVTAVNGSPRGRSSNTAVMLDALQKGFASAGDSVDTILLAEKNIHYCKGCYCCWSTTPGKCVHNDDMNQVIEKIRGADVLIIGSPLYFNNISGTLKVFFDRLTAAGGNPHEGQGEQGKGRAPKYIPVSNCGYPVRAQFDFVSLWFTRIAAMMRTEVTAEFYTTNGKVLSSPSDDQKDSRKRYLEYLEDCGRFLSQNTSLDAMRLEFSQKNILEF